MAADNVQVAPDSTGKKVQCFKNTIGADDVEAQAVVHVDSSGVEITTQPVSLATAPTTPVTGPVTDTQLRATPVPVSGTITASGPLTDTQLRASAVPVSAAALPLPSGAATETTLGGVLTTSDFDAKAGALTETAPTTDTASSGLNGRLQRIAQRITSLITAIGSPFQAGGSIGNTTFAVTNAGTFAVQAAGTEADGANVTLGAKADAKSTATDTTPITAMSVLKQISASVQTPPSQAVTNAGTFAVQSASTLAAETTKVIGTVNVASAQTIAVTNAGTFATQANEVPDAASTYAPTNASSTVYATSLVIKGSAGVLFNITGYSSCASDQFIQLHNATSLPADTSVPVITFIVRAGRNFSLSFGGKFGRYFSTGIVICNSSTGPTKTIGAADCWFDAQYK